MGDDDCSDLHAFQHLQMHGDGAARGFLPRERSGAVEPRSDHPVTLGKRLSHAVSQPLGSTKTAASPATSFRAASGAATTGVPEAIASSTGRPKPS